MSEYRYYEFQTIDRPLTQQQMSELRAYSTRAQITALSFINHYEWGDFKGDPDNWMETYFDAFLHIANCNLRWFMLRLPKEFLRRDHISRYCTDACMSYRATKDHLVLSFYSEEQEDDFDDGSGWMGALVPLRADLMRGDDEVVTVLQDLHDLAEMQNITSEFSQRMDAMC